MTPQAALSILTERFPDRYITINGEISSHPESHYRDQRETKASVAVYVENSNGPHYKAATLEAAVNACLADNSHPSADLAHATEIIAAVERPEATYPAMVVNDV